MSVLRWRRPSALLLACLLASPVVLNASATAGELEPVYSAADSTAPAVTYANLYESERFWPYQIQLVEPWRPLGHEGDFGWGQGVLLRVAPSGLLRIDFARFGKHWVPARATDVIERANRVRRGEEHKFAPNLTLALKQRLLDPSRKTLAPIQLDLMEQEAFLLVFADPSGDDFSEIARALGRFRKKEGLVIVLLAQGGYVDAYVYKRCHEASWPGAFLFDRFARAYTEGLLDVDAGDRPPFVQLATREGRLIHAAPWSEGAPDAIQRALDELRGSHHGEMEAARLR